MERNSKKLLKIKLIDSDSKEILQWILDGNMVAKINNKIKLCKSGKQVDRFFNGI